MEYIQNMFNNFDSSTDKKKRFKSYQTRVNTAIVNRVTDINCWCSL